MVRGIVYFQKGKELDIRGEGEKTWRGVKWNISLTFCQEKKRKEKLPRGAFLDTSTIGRRDSQGTPQHHHQPPSVWQPEMDGSVSSRNTPQDCGVSFPPLKFSVLSLGGIQLGARGCPPLSQASVSPSRVTAGGLEGPAPR